MSKKASWVENKPEIERTLHCTHPEIRRLLTHLPPRSPKVVSETLWTCTKSCVSGVLLECEEVVWNA